MQVSQIELVKFSPEHLDGALALSRQAGWPHRREDWAMLLSLSRGIVALEDGRVAGTTLVTPYGAGAAAINMVIVDESLRGRGIGRRLMDFALAECEGRECRLVATKEGLPLYAKLGFRETGTILQHQGTITVAKPHEEVSWSDAGNIAECAAMDRAACGLDRSALISVLAADGRLAVSRRNGRLTGFAVLRSFGRGELVGPVVATDKDDAKALISFLFAARPNSFLRVDTSKAAGLSRWLSRQGLAHVGGGIAMRRGGTDKATTTTAAFTTFALASQALG